jgi:class 3 adenylate cyclase
MLPSGTVTFLFTDIEGSTKLAQEYPDAMPALMARHNEILDQAIQNHNGFVFQIVGDSFCASFHQANDALQAALDAQRHVLAEPWSPAAIKVRMGIHTGTAQLKRVGDTNQYSGYTTLALTQRIMSAGHGGQILLSQTAHDSITAELPPQMQLLDMGKQQLKDTFIRWRFQTCPQNFHVSKRWKSLIIIFLHSLLPSSDVRRKFMRFKGLLHPTGS